MLMSEIKQNISKVDFFEPAKTETYKSYRKGFDK